MKLKTKLIPLASVAAVCATVAPISLTSCGKGGFVDLTDLYTPTIDRVTGPITDKTGNEGNAFCKDFYFEQISKNTKIYQEDFYYGHSLYLQMICQDFGMVLNNAKAKIYDISCRKSSYVYEWETDTGFINVPIWTMSFTAEYDLTLRQPQNYLGIEDATLIRNHGKFIVKNMPMWLSYFSKEHDEGYSIGFTPRFLFNENPSPELFDSFNWSLEQDTTSTLTRRFQGTDLEYIIDYPTHIIAQDREGFVAIMTQPMETVAGVNDICGSYYMAKLDYAGK